MGKGQQKRSWTITENAVVGNLQEVPGRTTFGLGGGGSNGLGNCPRGQPRSCTRSASIHPCI